MAKGIVMKERQDILSLSAQLGKFENTSNRLPPVDKWHPKLSGDIDIIIKKNGSWIHEGDEIKRDKLVRTFSTILRKEGQDYFLLTPVEKWRITVEDCPFIIVLADIKQINGVQIISLITNVGDQIELGESTFHQDKEEAPFIVIRSELRARLSRNVYYQLAEIAEENKEGIYIVKSNGTDHVLG